MDYVENRIVPLGYTEDPLEELDSDNEQDRNYTRLQYGFGFGGCPGGCDQCYTDFL